MEEKRKPQIHLTSRFENSTIVNGSFIRGNCTVHDSKIGEDCRINEKVSIKHSEIGNKVDINSDTHIEVVIIEDNVQIGPNSTVIGVWHKIWERGADREDLYNNVIIKSGVLIGAGCIILPGVEIGEGSVIGAGVVVTKNIPSFHICFGIPPNQTIKSLKEWLDQK